MSIICVLALGHKSKEWSYQHKFNYLDEFSGHVLQTVAVYIARCDRCGEPISKKVKI